MPTRKPLTPPPAVAINSTGRAAMLAPSGPARLENARKLPLDQIDLNPQQARQQFDEAALDELTESVRQHGVLQPILVRPVGERWEIIAGERRYRAAVRAQLGTIPALIRDDLEGPDSAVVTALENLQREDLLPGDEARQYSRLLDALECSAHDLADRLSRSHDRISRLLKLLREAPDELDAIDRGEQTISGAMQVLAARRADPSILSQIATKSQGGSSLENGVVRTPRADMPAPHATPDTVAFKRVYTFQQQMRKFPPAVIPDSVRETYRRAVGDLLDELTAYYKALSAEAKAD